MTIDSLNETAAASGSSNKFLDSFPRRGELKDFPPDEELFRQGHPIRSICLLKDGLINLTYTNPQGQEMTTELRRAESILGAATVIAQRPAPVTAITFAPCRVYCLATEVFLMLVNTDAEFARAVLEVVSRQSYQQTLRYVSLATSSARARLAQTLLQFVPSAVPPGELRLDLPGRRADLAKLLAIRPEHLSRQLGALEKAGVIRRGKGWIYVRSLEQLRREAEGDQL